MIASLLRSAALAVTLTVLTAAAAAAADDYTLPFHDPGVKLNYGVDRDPRTCYQLDYTGQLHITCNPVQGRVYDGHTGQDWPMNTGSVVVAARDGVVIDYVESFGTNQYGPHGNFVLVGHSDGKRTLYYHLAQNGADVTRGQSVAAGQAIGKSGCSGLCRGAHLHFELLKLAGGQWVWTDPHFERRWTTWPARVPFLASYVRESNAGVERIKRGSTIFHWVEFRNDGGRTWRNNIGVGRILLGTWNPAQRASAFRASDWGSSWFATNLDQASVAPGGVGRFTFGLYGGPPPGRYNESFNLLANSLKWFDHARLGGFYVPIDVVPGTAPLSQPQ